MHADYIPDIVAIVAPNDKKPNADQKTSQIIPNMTAGVPSMVVHMPGNSRLIIITTPLSPAVNAPMPTAIELCPTNTINSPNKLGNIVRK